MKADRTAKYNPDSLASEYRHSECVITPLYCAAETIFSAKLRLMDDKRNLMGYALSCREVPPKRWASAVQVLGGQSIGAVTRCRPNNSKNPGFKDK